MNMARFALLYTGRLLDAHEVFEPPILFRVSKIELQLEAQPIIVDQLRIAQCQITTE